jgi:hypothetical protein
MNEYAPWWSRDLVDGRGPADLQHDGAESKHNSEFMHALVHSSTENENHLSIRHIIFSSKKHYTNIPKYKLSIYMFNSDHYSRQESR